MTLSIVTRAGAVTIDQPPAAGQECDTCPAGAQVRLAVELNEREALTELALCGDCLAEALADHYGTDSATLRDLTRDRSRDGEGDPLDLDTLGEGPGR